MTARKTTKTEAPPAPSPDVVDFSNMGLLERLWHVQTEAPAANGTTEAYKGTYAPRTAIWDAILKPLFEKYGLVFTCQQSAYLYDDTVNNAKVWAPLLIFSIHRMEDMRPNHHDLFMKFYLYPGTEQEIGKQETYFNRYALIHLTGISIDRDPSDPDNPQSGGSSTPKRKATPRPKLDPTLVSSVQTNKQNDEDEFE